MTWLIARRELRALYGTAAGWLALASAQLLLAWLLFAQLDVYQRILPHLRAADSPLGLFDLILKPLFSATALALMALVPLLGMRSFAGEISSGRMALFLSSPVSARQLVLGKWLGLFLASLPMLLASLAMGLWLSLGSTPDHGRLAASGLGLALLLGLICALVVWLSASNPQALGAVALSWALLWLLWLVDANGANSLRALSLKSHLLPFFDGRVRSQDLAWFGLIGLCALAFASHRVWRLGGGR